MNEPAKGISVGCIGDRACIRIVGRGTFQNSQPLRQFALHQIDLGHQQFVVDLSQCQGMDSTFLGMLAGIGLRLRKKRGPAPIHIVNVSPHNLDLLQTLSLNRLFILDSTAPPSLAETDYHLLPDTDLTRLAHALDKDETADLMIEAHKNLVRADKRNAPKFRELTRFLREAIERRRRNQEITKL